MKSAYTIYEPLPGQAEKILLILRRSGLENHEYVLQTCILMYITNVPHRERVKSDCNMDIVLEITRY